MPIPRTGSPPAGASVPRERLRHCGLGAPPLTTSVGRTAAWNSQPRPRDTASPDSRPSTANGQRRALWPTPQTVAYANRTPRCRTTCYTRSRPQRVRAREPRRTAAACAVITRNLMPSAAENDDLPAYLYTDSRPRMLAHAALSASAPAIDLARASRQSRFMGWWLRDTLARPYVEGSHDGRTRADQWAAA
jgi:hypothetical protein